MFLKEIFFPRFCLGCKKIGKYICFSCRRKLIILENFSCLYCKLESPNGLTHQLCTQENGIDGFISVFKYNNLLKKIIKIIKYRLASDVLEELISIADFRVKESLLFFTCLDSPFFQAIPLSRQRLRARGFNQAQIIINKLQKNANLSSVNCLIRVKNTPPQAQISDRQERLRNVQGAFSVPGELKKEVAGRKFVLVDDVVTSGSTVREAARTLKLAGAVKVYVFSLAKG